MCTHPVLGVNSALNCRRFNACMYLYICIYIYIYLFITAQEQPPQFLLLMKKNPSHNHDCVRIGFGGGARQYFCVCCTDTIRFAEYILKCISSNFCLLHVSSVRVAALIASSVRALYRSLSSSSWFASVYFLHRTLCSMVSSLLRVCWHQGGGSRRYVSGKLVLLVGI